MALRNESRVGLIVVSAIAALIVIYVFLGGLGLRKSSYPVHAIFSDVGRLDKGADVRLAGVKVGLVSLVKLTPQNEARVEMLIWKDNFIPADSVARITTGAFIGDHYVEILPGSKGQLVRAGGRLRSERPAQFEDLMEQTSALVGDLRTAAESVNSLLGDKQLVAAIKDTINELNVTFNSASELFESANTLLGDTSPEIEQVFVRLSEAAANVEKVTSRADQMLSGSIEPNVEAMMGDAAAAVGALSDTLSEARYLLDQMNSGAASARMVLDKVSNAADKAGEMMTTLQEASEGVRDITTDPQMHEDLKKAVENAAEATEQAKQMLTGLNEKFGGGGGTSPGRKAAIPDYGTVVDSLWNTDTGDYRFNAGYTFAGSGKSFYRLGIQDIGESSGVNAQFGRTLGARDAFRYGLYDSRFGLGYDHRLGSALFSAEVFRPNDPELELRTVIELNSAMGLYGGLTDAWDSDQRQFLLGLRYRK